MTVFYVTPKGYVHLEKLMPSNAWKLITDYLKEHGLETAAGLISLLNAVLQLPG